MCSFDVKTVQATKINNNIHDLGGIFDPHLKVRSGIFIGHDSGSVDSRVCRPLSFPALLFFLSEEEREEGMRRSRWTEKREGGGRREGGRAERG